MSNRKDDKFDRQRRAVQQATDQRADHHSARAARSIPAGSDCQHTRNATCEHCAPILSDADAAADLAGTPRPSLDEKIAADYGVGATQAEGYLAEQDATNATATAATRSVGALAGTDHPDRDALNRHVAQGTDQAKTPDGSVPIRQLGIGNEFTIRPGSLPVYLAVKADRSAGITAAHDITPGAKYPTVLHIPDDQAVWPSLRPSGEPPKVIVPTVGRKVWFYPGGGIWPAGMQVFPGTDYDGGVSQPLDATIVYVHDDRKVNLHVIDHAGHAFPVRDVQLVQPGDQCCGGGHRAEWMPFQVKQAGKA